MKKAWIFIVTVIVLGVLSACTTSRPYTADRYDDAQDRALTSEPVYQVFLLGDGGSASLEPLQPALRLLKTHLSQADSNAAVVFLGNNLYCCGLADSGAVRREQDERHLRAQLSVVEDFAGRVVFIPGNQDWNNSSPGGLEAVARQERFVEAHLDRGNTFLPDGGFPGPVKVDLNDRLTLLVIDTEWWLHEHNKSFGDTGEYDLEEDANFLLELDDLVKRNDDKDLIVVGHHPLFTNGSHAGIRSLGDHLFPLRNIHPALAIPLPVVGSFVRINSERQDLNHSRYQSLRVSLTRIFSQHEDLIYAAGHDHTLQYFPVTSSGGSAQHYIVSGAGSQSHKVGRGRGAAFTAGSVEGFAVLNQYRDGSIWLEMWAAVEDDSAGHLLFRTEIKGPAHELDDPVVTSVADAPDYSDSTVTLPVNTDYEAGILKEVFLGSHHRDAWATPIEAPVFDIGREAGGLTPVKRGGGMQTTSLRLKGRDDREYVLRSIDKDPSRSVPVNLQGTIATDIVQDQIASIHPYGAFIIPPLADAAGVYHTNPKPVFVPDDPRLGIYNDLFAGQLAMFEERPNDDMSHQPSFGRSRDVVSAGKLYRKLNDDNNHRVDARSFARARLFDMLLSDWDRHKDQWRWASFEPYELDPSLEGEARTEGKIYRPIPRDRDFAFNKMNGLFPSLASQFNPKFQDFTENYGRLSGLTQNGLSQDRRFISPLERQAFIEIADSIRAALTDEVIDAAVRQWPEAIYERDGAETARLLKIRRDKLTDIAEEYYEMHARIVDVVGSNKQERFEITRLDNDSTRVVVYKTTKSGEQRKVFYDRTFLDEETQEIRLYGLAGDDAFIVQGDVRHGILIRAIGGAGRDVFVDHSRVRGGSKQTRFYDTETGNAWDVGVETRLIRSDDDPAVNDYDPNEFRHNQMWLLLFFGHNKDDGFFLGGGAKITRRGFRKKSYAAEHRIKANLAATTQAFNVVYEGHYVDVFGPWDVMLDAEYLSPDNIRNFYGLGNETENEADDRAFYQARLTQARLAPSLYEDTEAGVSLRIGPKLEITRVREDDGRFLAIQPGISEATFDDQWFAGGDLEITLDTRDIAVNPRLGFIWTNLAALNVGVRNNTDTFARLSTDLAFYLSPSLSPQVTLAGRVGGAHNIGDFPFYSAVTLGGKENLRGFRSTRFAGRTSFYQNVDLRLELFKFSTYLAIGKAGLMGFFDNGRVWTDGESSDAWHQGYGGGVWFELFNTFVLNTYAGFSDDDQTLTVQLGFQY